MAGINSVTVSFVQTVQFANQKVEYLLDFFGVNDRYKESNNLTRYTSHSQRGEVVIAVNNIQPGYNYVLEVSCDH